MGRSTIFSFAFLVLLSTISKGQNLSSRDSISLFYEEFFNSIESDYLYSKEVNWKDLKTFGLEEALKAKSFESSLSATSLIFDSIKCNHCQLFSTDGFYGSSLNKSFSQDDFSREFLLEYQKQPPFEVKLIRENIGYIAIPGMLMVGLSQDSLNLATQKMYDQVAALAKNNTIKGWIVDVRLNTGGNVYPMLASLHPLLGNSIMYTELDANGKVVQTNQLKDGGFYCGKKLEAKAKVSIPPNVDIPVAIITGKMTGSAGEDIAVAFKNRKNTLFIGEKTYGLLTGNDMVELPFGTQLALTTCYVADENKVYREYITPDKTVSKKDNYEDLSKDGNIVVAVEFILHQEK